MCGITGFINLRPHDELSGKQKIILRHLMQGISTRGRDASGGAFWHGGNGKDCPTCSLIKAPRTSAQMALSPLFNSMLCRGPLKMFIGHARAATHGSKMNNLNNHPFMTRSKEVFLVHNGVIGYEGSKEVKDLLLGECDTEVLIRNIEKLGIKDGFSKAASWWHPSYAVLILYPKLGKLYALRRSNPIWWVKVEDKDLEGIYIASTAEIIKEAFKEGLKKNYTARTLAENKLFNWNDKGALVQIKDYTGETKDGFRHQSYGGYGYNYKRDYYGHWWEPEDQDQEDLKVLKGV